MILLKKLLPVFLLAFVAMAGCKKTKYNFDDLHPTVKSFFTIGNTELNIDEAIHFKNASLNAESYTWDFGDGTTATEKEPSKTYITPGTYTVKLKAVGPGGTGNYSKDLVIIDPNAVIDTDKELYFIEYGSKLVRKISLIPGSAAETVVNMTGKEAHGMAYDSVNKKIYYCDFQNANAGKIWRMDADGSNPVEVLSGLSAPYGVALNLAEGKMYIADGANVSRANLDGSGFEKSFIPVFGGALRAIGFNSKTNIIYFYEVNNEDLYAAKSDGTGAGKIIEGAYGYGIFVDVVNQKIYYDDRRKTGIMQANADGSGIVKIANVAGNRGGSGITVDYKDNKLYWAETNNGLIKRSNLDGTGAETFLSGVNNPRGMFIK
ncbi:PKD domain-containing protein [Niabella pedocola]|uniref:PKD domain-containing protein n=1 Tax=Niabella pedocola TaxID=1752077 RepID=UPI00293E28EE|nr:PKD domain-containing protein [Niabella pedocola]